ncbi:MAG TPA: serine/threonine-protein kinase [Mycobacteriales bacterium]|nr:serine/threonine-protein kinase [Mycobacteriales bacterium]
MSSTTPPFEGDLLDGRYRLGALLGSGGVAEVYRAFDERLHRDVAIKLFRVDVADQLHRHEDEMRTLARLDHPSLVTVLDAGEDDVSHRPYLVMSLVEGPTLAEELRYGALPSDRVAEIGIALADGLAYVHSQGLIHRDVKPANVLISADGRVHLADFGIARLVDASHVTNAGEVVGTPAYFAPEQVTGEPVGPPADVYSLGLVLLECLTGRREYEGQPMEVAMARINRPPAIPANLPTAWRDVLGGMTARLPSARLSASHVAERLRRVSEPVTDATVAMGIPPAAPATVAMPAPTAVLTSDVAAPPPPPARRQQRMWPWVLGALVLAAVAAAVVALVVDNGSSGNNAKSPRGCHDLPNLNGRVGSDFSHLTDLVCSGPISDAASHALAPYLPQLADSVKSKDVSRLDAVDSNMSTEISRQEDDNHLTPPQAQDIANALTAFYTDAKSRLLKPTPSPTPTVSPSESESPTESSSPTEEPSTEPETTSPSASPSKTPKQTPKQTPTTTPSSTLTLGF